MVERWNGGTKLPEHLSVQPGAKRRSARSTVPPFHRSTVPPFHRSTVPPFHRSTVPPFHRSTVPPFHRSTVPPLRLPDPRSQRLRSHHRVAVFAAPRGLELRHVAERTVDAPFGRRMRVGV